ncbi:MAG: histidinol dehydrogenase [Oscillospiraceae bacterium]|nr:histidinol dehydrogenase [Oscillospiraceae bacterium]
MLNIYNANVYDIYDESNADNFFRKLRNRIDDKFDDALKAATEIIHNVQFYGDGAVRDYTKKFDGVELRNFYMTDEEINQAFQKCDKETVKVMEKAALNIEEYHKRQLQNSYVITKDGIIMGQRVMPIERVALYVPGGTAAYPSSVLMNAIPAKIAGVNEMTIFTPPKNEGISPSIIAAAKICGIDKIVKVGGVQAIAAAAYGTQSIKPVSKIVGPGSFYVAAAKKLVYGTVDIDMIAGPSEILIIADKTANPKYIAADLMSQAEHDILASSVLVTDSEELINQVDAELEKQIQNLSRREIIEKSLTEYGGCVLCENITEAIKIANFIAPEHLELVVENGFEKLDLIKNAGSVFVGDYSPEPLGDYFAGTNHVLPTNGTAKFSSPLGVDSFIKKSSFIYYSRERLSDVSGDIIKFAEAEKLTAHANSLKVRFDDGK